MSVDQSMMAQILAKRLQQAVPQGGSFGGGAAGPQMQGQISPFNAAASLAQKAMLMRALQVHQQQQQQQQAQGMLPGTQAQIAQDPQIQALQQPGQMDPMLLQQMQQQVPGSQ